MLARWDAGSEAAFAAEMNTCARLLGLRSTRYADASGADPATVSTASDQFRLTVAALQILAFRQIVALPRQRRRGPGTRPGRPAGRRPGERVQRVDLRAAPAAVGYFGAS